MNKIVKAFIIVLCSNFLLLPFNYSTNAQVTDKIHVRANWNMVSLPLKVQDAHYLTIFPDAISHPFEYCADCQDDTLRLGKSYWIKFASAKSYIINGEEIQSILIDVSAGWNMIGSISYPIPVSSIKSDPPGIIISDFFEYNASPGYEKADTIIPGSGYWVKVNQAGRLILSSMGYPCPGIPTIEYDGKTYNTIQIGNQCWLKENLDVGIRVSGILNPENNGIIEKYCYKDDSTYCDTYGGLYQWNEAMQYTNMEGEQGICPQGWHIPTIAEFETLRTDFDFDGNALKAIGQGTGDGAGTNTSGFSALLAGWRIRWSGFYALGIYTGYWSSTEGFSGSALCMTLENSDSITTVGYSETQNGNSIRCLKD